MPSVPPRLRRHGFLWEHTDCARVAVVRAVRLWCNRRRAGTVEVQPPRTRRRAPPSACFRPRPPMRSLLPLALFCAPALCEADEPCPERRAFPNMRYEERWEDLADPRCRTERFDGLKAIDLGDDRALSLGGDVRLRYERFSDPGFGRDPRDRNGYFLHRALFHAHLRLTPRLNAFAQLESSDVYGRRPGPRASDRNTLDFNQLFIDWTAWQDGDDRATLRIGRQEVELGSAQFTSSRDGLNDRLAFEGVRFIGNVAGWRLHGMATRVVPTRPGTFDDYTGALDTQSGVFVARSHSLLPDGNAVVYLNRRTRPSSLYADSVEAEQRITLGTRWWGNDGTWDYNLEAGRQSGSLGEAPIAAWYASADNGITLRSLRWRPRLGLRANVGSGDRRQGDREVNTFSPLFASTAYSGLAGLIGPSNSVAFAPSVQLRPTDEHVVTVGVIGFWRQSTGDGIYNIFSEVQRQPGSSESRHVGTQTTAQLTWTPTRHVTVVTVLSYFQAGAFLRETPPGKSTSYFTMWWVYRF